MVFPLGCQPLISLGRNPEGEDLKKIEALPNYRNGQFNNLYPSSPAPTNSNTQLGNSTTQSQEADGLRRIEGLPNNNGQSGGQEQSSSTSSQTTNQPSRGPRWLRMTKYLFNKPQITRPSKRLPVMITDLKKTSFAKPTVIWFGHSSALLKTATANILFDPSFSGFAGPLKGLVKAYPGTNAYDGRDMPTIDALVISHDHYDHLDYQTIKQLKKKVKRVIVPIGVGSHFRKWGYDPGKITELNWNESVKLNDSVTITATSAHHRSNRTFEQRKTLWASYVIKADGYKIYFSGDTGYSKHFKDIGDQYGPFDLALLECGQYNTRWSQNHMFPEQTAQAALDLRTAMTLPIHWGKFAESDHPWNESVNRLLVKAEALNIPVTIPFIGQPYTIGEPIVQVNWWNMY